MPNLKNSLHNINSFFATPSQSLQRDKSAANSDKFGFLTYGSLLDSNVRTALNKIHLTPTVKEEVPYQILVDMDKHNWVPIRAWREYFHISLETMAKKIEMGTSSYLELEENPENLNAIQARAIVKELGITLIILYNSIEKYKIIQKNKLN